MSTLIMSFSFYPQGSWFISSSIKGQMQLTNKQKMYDISSDIKADALWTATFVTELLKSVSEDYLHNADDALCKILDPSLSYSLFVHCWHASELELKANVKRCLSEVCLFFTIVWCQMNLAAGRTFLTGEARSDHRYFFLLFIYQTESKMVSDKPKKRVTSLSFN